MFQRHNIDTLFYLILANNDHLFENQLQMNINVFFVDERRARHPSVISRTNHERVSNLLYWKNHYALITSIYGIFSDITKNNPQ